MNNKSPSVCCCLMGTLQCVDCPALQACWLVKCWLVFLRFQLTEWHSVQVNKGVAYVIYVQFYHHGTLCQHSEWNVFTVD